MRGGAISPAGLPAAAIGWVWVVTGSKPEASAAPRPPVAPTPTSSPGDRVFLTKGQLAQAKSDGTFDRPVTSLLAVHRPMHYGDYLWDDRGVPAGPTWIRIDLAKQLISVFRAGHEIGTAVIVYGADGLPTPTGKFPILAKLKDHRSQTYDAPMPYTLRLTADGVSIHASNVRWGYATHGCIGVPEAFAAKLFDAVKVGDDVLIVGNDSPSSKRA